MGRLVADVPDGVHLKFQTAAKTSNLYMTEVIPLAVNQFLGLNLSLQELGLKSELESRLNARMKEEE